MWAWTLLAAAAVLSNAVEGAGAGAARLICYAESARTESFSECTHLVYSGDARGDQLENILKEYKQNNPRIKILLRINEADKDLKTLLKSKSINGLELHDVHRSLNRTKVLETVQEVRSILSKSGGGPLFVSLPAHPELLAKYYDLRALVKMVDLMLVETDSLGMMKKMTYHPSRLSGVWDMMNTDSIVDLVTGLGVPSSKVVISLPASAKKFTLVNETLSTPGSPTADDEPTDIDQAELCKLLQDGRWTLERDQDLSAPYAFKNKTWIAFEDSSSVDVKGKYARIRGLAGLALMQADKDVETPCGPTLKAALGKVLNQQSRAPRAVVLRSLEQEILSPHARVLDALQVSPYRITQVVDADGVIHSIREDTRTEFSCSRQGYFVHPRSCNRFYRCVKFDQLSPDYTVFEFDCPAGLAFDERYEVCVWPGSLPHSHACPGSSEIAPVPKTRFVCPDHEGYYADPENCRWFFACLDHGKAPLTAYEFRCPFGLGFDADRLKCDWPWLVPACGNIARYEAEAFGYSGAALSGATGYYGQTADAINIAAHQSLVSGAALGNLVGIQAGYLNKNDVLDGNFIASQELGNGQYHGLDQSHQIAYSNGLVQPTKYEEKYTSGSLLLDDFRQPYNGNAHAHSIELGNKANTYTGDLKLVSAAYKPNYNQDDSGAYVHDPSGDRAEPYRHIDIPGSPYVHDYSSIKESNDYLDYKHGDSGYYQDNARLYANGKYLAGVYQKDSLTEQNSASAGATNLGQYAEYYGDRNNAYLQDVKAFTGGSHTLAAGSANVGLVGKTTLVDAGYADQGSYFNIINNAKAIENTQHAHVKYVAQPAVSINHVGTDAHNYDSYSYVTNPTASVIPTTATPFAVTTVSQPQITYKTTYVPIAQKTDIKEVFGYNKPALTLVQPTLQPIQQFVTPKVQITDFNQAVDHETFQNRGNSFVSESNVESGYDYPKPETKFEDGVTAAPPVQLSTYQPQSFVHQTFHNTETVNHGYSTPSPTLAIEEPFKKIVAYTTGPPTTYNEPTQSTYIPSSYSHQTVHNFNSNKYNIESNFDSGVNVEVPQSVVQYSTPQPSVESYQPQVYSHQVLHKTNNILAQPADGYDYSKPNVQFEEIQQTYNEVSTQPPTKSVQPKPQYFSHQTIHRYEPQTYASSYSAKAPQIEIKNPQTSVTFYQNPLLEYKDNIAPITYIKQTPTGFTQPIVKQETQHYELDKNYNNVQINHGYNYNQPEIQRGTLNSENAYSFANDVSHQYYHQYDTSNQNQNENKKDVVFVSTTPAKLAYETHYQEYQSPKEETAYQGPEYIAPKTENTVTYTKNFPIYEQKVQSNNYQYEKQYASQQDEQVSTAQKSAPVQYISFNTLHTQPKSYQDTSVTYKPASYESPEIQVGYKAEEYLPPVAPTEFVSPTYKPVAYSSSTSKEYLPPTSAPTYNEYLPPKVESTTAQEYLASPEPTYKAEEYLPPKVESTYLPPPTTERYFRKPTKPTTAYNYVESTTFKAPEYLPPQDEPRIVNFESFGLRNTDSSSKTRLNPYKDYSNEGDYEYSTISQKNQNLNEQYDSHLLGFGTVGPDAGLVSPAAYTTSSPVRSSTEIHTVTPKVTSTTPSSNVIQSLVEITPSPIPTRRTKPKVSVVTKVNDFNPFLVRKLGAVCSCQSPVYVLKGRKPNVSNQQDYSIDYDFDNIGNDQKYNEYANYEITRNKSPVTSTTFNPIIVPDDSYYQDIPDRDYNIAITPKSKEFYSDNVVSSTPVYPTSERIIRVRPRVKATLAPTYSDIFLKQSTPTPIIVEDVETVEAGANSQNRQGSIDCQRAGLFRHPKQCNKFYSCKWDCTKQKFIVHTFNCPIQLSFDPTLGACNWPSQGPACQGDTLLSNSL